MRRRSIWTLLWLLWLAGFLAIEIPAALNRRDGDTLSEHIWWLIGRGKRLTPGVQARRIAFLSFAAWLVVHLLTGWV